MRENTRQRDMGMEINDTEAETVSEIQINKRHVCPNIYPPDAASGEKMSIPPPSSVGTTHPHSFSQNSLWSGVSKVFSDKLLPEGSKVKQ